MYLKFVHLLSLFSALIILFQFFQDPCYHERPIVTAWIADISSQIHATVDLSVKFPTRSPLKVKHIFLNSLLAWDIIITAMLTTGSCCVVGRNEDAINQILDLLIFFLPDVGQIHCSRYTSNRFCGGLNLQVNTHIFWLKKIISVLFSIPGLVRGCSRHAQH